MAVCALAFCFCLTGCSAKWHVNRAVKKDPTLLQVDTLTIRDTVTHITDRVEVDSVFMLSSDTVTIVKDNLTVKHFYSRDSVYIFAECESDTIRIPYEKKVPITKVVVNDPIFPKWLWIVLSLVVGLYFLNKKLK